MEPSDAEAVEAVLAGHTPAFGDLYARYVSLILAVCFDTTGQVHQAEDLAQDVFLRAYRNLGKLKQPEQFGAWLVGTAQNVCREWRRGRARDRHRYTEDTSSLSTPSKEDGSDEVENLRRALSELPETERLAVHLFYLFEQPAEHARTVMGLSQSGFYRTLDRARSRLRAFLSQKPEAYR